MPGINQNTIHLYGNEDFKDIHFIGICGVAMASVAVELHRSGFNVTGSDSSFYPPMGDFLTREGVSTFHGFNPENLQAGGLIVIGNAVSRGNPELEAALNAGLPFISLPELISRRYLHSRKSIVISGTHGKTTTSAMVAHILKDAGREPGWLIGGIPANLARPCMFGEGEEFVIEGDEYDSVFYDKRAKFLSYRPYYAILTGIEFDHADIFADLNSIESTFKLFVNLIPRAGALAVNGDDELAVKVASNAMCKVITFGFKQGNHWRIDHASRSLESKDGSEHTLALQTQGRHNLLNAAGAICLANETGVEPRIAISALKEFRGVARRLEKVIETDRIVLYDDFAHHPSEIAASIQAVREEHPRRRIWAIVEPRSNTMVRNILEDDLIDALRTADVVVLGGIHRIERIAPSDRLNRRNVIERISRIGVSAQLFDDSETILKFVIKNVKPKDAIILMSNGSFGGLRELLHKFASE